VELETSIAKRAAITRLSGLFSLFGLISAETRKLMKREERDGQKTGKLDSLIAIELAKLSAVSYELVVRLSSRFLSASGLVRSGCGRLYLRLIGRVFV